MSMPKTMNAWIRLVATEQDKRLLNEISKRNGDAGFSATVRRLIREEAQRLNIEMGTNGHEAHAAQHAAAGVQR
ncbi:MAG: hypothetical protein BroJett021_28230 [Chloroflexota bacterium]|nr:MAG: hypothetical protein BroJett021_28230 [Chloroflexota bacterium]